MSHGISQGVALVDCNNFYASCERLFRPDLKYRPLIVLSNNDGCVVARSAEAKALGIAMGAPWFRIKHDARRHRIAVFSSNYALYADISSRVMQVLEELAPQVEAYSIDEAFVDMTGMQEARARIDFGQQIKHRLAAWTGIPVGVGMAPTRTLAKLANHAAKRYPATGGGGVVDLFAPERQRRLLALTPVEAIWGVGRRLAGHLKVMGIHSALEMADLPAGLLGERFSVVLERTRRELNGEACIRPADLDAKRQQLVSSRSFGQRVESFMAMREAVSSHVARAAERLRRQQSEALVVSVSIRTGLHTLNEPHYSNAATGRLATPSADTRELAALANRLLQRIWKPGYRYAKAGITLSGFYPPGHYQPGLFDAPSRHRHGKALMTVLDRINQSASGSVFFAGAGTTASRRHWQMQRQRLSPGYTTRWSDIARVR